MSAIHQARHLGRTQAAAAGDRAPATALRLPLSGPRQGEAMTARAEHELLTVAEAADRLRVTGRFIRMLIADGTLPALRLGKRSIRLRADDVDRVLRPVERWEDGPRKGGRQGRL